jgi:hypothetical protein
MSYYVPPATQVSKEPFSSISKTENISDADDDLLHSSIQTESISKSVFEKQQQQEETGDHSSRIEDDEQSIQVKFVFLINLNKQLTIKI